MIVGHGDYEHWDKTYRSRFRSEIMPAAAKQLLEERRHLRARPRRGAGGHPRRSPADQRGRDSRAASLRLRPVHPARALHRVREGVPLGRQRRGRRARQGPEDRRRGRGRREADRPGPDDRGRGQRGHRHGAQGGQARRRARASRGRDPHRPEVRRRLLRAHRPRHRAGLSRGHPSGAAQAAIRRWPGARRSRASSSRSTPPTSFPSG